MAAVIVLSLIFTSDASIRRSCGLWPGSNKKVRAFVNYLALYLPWLNLFCLSSMLVLIMFVSLLKNSLDEKKNLRPPP